MTSKKCNVRNLAYIIYDGECPFCSRYVRMLRLRNSIGPLRLINARDGDLEVEEILSLGYDLDEGMVFRLGDQIYHGDQCIHMLAMLSSKYGLFNRVNAVIFKSKLLSRILYPALRIGRNSILALLGRKKLSETL